MKSKFLLIIFALSALVKLNAQSITQLPGEGALNYSKVFQGSGRDVSTDASCFFVRGKGMLSVGFEVQKNNTATWNSNSLWFKYRGNWIKILDLVKGPDKGAGPTGANHTAFVQVSGDPSPGNYWTTFFGPGLTNPTDQVCTINGLASNDGYEVYHSYIKNYGNLRIYNGNYLPQPGEITFRQSPADFNNNFNLQTLPWAPPYMYPVRNTDISTGVQALSDGYLAEHANQRRGNLAGIGAFESTPGRICVVINIVNLPPEMLDDPAGFRVHMFQDANTNHDRVFEWVFNSSENFMTAAPNSLAVTKDLCGKAKLTWANAYNQLPTDGQVDIKTAIFRNGTYIGIVDDTQTFFEDNTAAQDVEYDYTIRHVAFSESGKTYFRSPETAPVKGSVKPSPNEPISPTASIDKCNSRIDIGWGYNGANPDKFRIDYSFSATGTFTTLTNSLSGGARSFAHTGLTRGQDYYYRIYAINSCSVLSTTYATCNGISPADPAMATNVLATGNATGSIDLTWLDNANNETKYQIVRTDDEGNTILTDINPNQTSYTDASAAACRLYTYKIRVFNDCVLSGIVSTSQDTAVLPPPNLQTTFTSAKKLVASKGYFGNRVELAWSNNNGVNIDIFKIYRKQLGTALDSVQIASLGTGSAIFIDNTADARVFYRYTIVGVKQCNGVELLTNLSSDIGFRNPTGIVSGHIEYEGGVAVAGAKVLVNSTTGNSGNSLSLSNNGLVSIPASATNSLTNEMRCEFWLKPNAINGLVLNKANSFSFGHNGSNYQAKLYTSANPTTAVTINVPNTYTSSTSSTNTGTTVTSTTVNPGYTNTTTVSTSTTANTSTTITAVTYVDNVSSSYTLTTITTTVVNTVITNTTTGNNQWSHVALIYNGSQFKAFINGVLVGTVSATGNIENNTNSIVFGDATSSFNLDEFRLIGKAETDSIINLDYNRILNGDEPQFKCNLHFDEAYGSYTYDPSKVGNLFNGNDASFTGTNVAWSNDIPTSSQLGYYGVTNALGNYNVSGIRYLGTGENYNLVPQYQTHEFSPNTRAVYIGDASYVYNNQDFEDISSFPVTGTLFYKNTTCPVPDVSLKIDGLGVIKNGTPVVTDANGTFSISVPIGNHFISVEKFGHDMKAGRYPPVSGTHNFQAPISGIQFVDSTLVKLIGRVVGGKIEADKAPGMGRSKNNIGQAKIMIATPLTGTPCFTAAVITNSASGEYEFNVPPMDYKVLDAFVMTNSVVIAKNKLSNTGNVIELTNVLMKTTVIDTLKNNLGGIVNIDTAEFNKRIDFIYRNSPVIDVRNGDGTILHGEDTLYFTGSKIAIRPIETNTTTLGNYGWGVLNWPIFKQNKEYSFNVFANEIYTNTDNGNKDTVLLSGSVQVTNQMVDGADPNANFNFVNGVGSYSFTCGQPNLASIPGTPDLSYTKNIQIAVTPDGAATQYWEPNTTITPSNKNYHAYVYGQRVTGTGISTQGPEKVDFILRDPPGSGSSSTWATSNSVSKSTSISTNFSSSTGLETSLLIGKSAHVGLGYAEKIEVDNNVTLGLNVSTSFDTENSMTETISSSYAVSTRDDADNVGAPADIFIGRSRNWLMGPTGSIEMVDVAKCAGRCFGPVVGGKQMAKVAGFAISPNGVKTRFSYTQNEIETVVIPTLEALRTNILTTRPYYTIVAPATHSLFASNNDDPLWGTAKTSTNPAIYDNADTTGSSYTFHGLLKFKTDTVRLINSQIALWKSTLAQNEKEKYLAKFSTNTPTVIPNPNFKNPFTDSPTITLYPPLLQDNFTLGSAVVTNAYQVDNEDSYSESYEVAVDESLAAQIGADIGGLGFQFNPHVSFTQGNTKGSSTTNSTSNSMEYTLTDGDPGDVMSVDVYRYGLSNIFITRGGQTMCPYEDAVVCHYWDPANPDKWISSHDYNDAGYHTLANATVQREIPDISITPAVQYNIPSNQPAVYQLVLSNQSPLTVNNDIDLQVRIASVSNPDGAVCKIDGQNANDIFNIPSGSSIIKTLTIERGPIEIDYDSLMVIFSSACSEDIADTAYVSVHFIPTCTDLAINTPVDNFVINNNNNSLQNIIIDEYNYNFGAAQNTNTVTGSAHPSFGLEKIGFEFKPANSSQWLQIREFYKFPNAVGSNSLYPIPQGQVYTQYGWTVTPQSYADGNYEIRVVSYCYNKDGSYATVYSPVHAGVMDRVNPHPFGTPSPGDGILDPNDDISIQFNEPIDISSLSYAPITDTTGNFDIRGVLNGTNIRHSESLNFDGTSDYAEVTGGASLQKRSFTIEFWAKLNNTNVNQTVISQGTDNVQRMSIGFDNTNKLKFQLGNMVAVTTNPVSLPTDWHHYAVVYDYANTDATLFVDGSLAGTNNNFVVDYMGSGKLAFGKAIPANNEYFGGNLHEMRLWNKVKTQADVVVTMNEVLNRNQANLLYNWKMDEADGAFAKDDIRNRDANIFGATWEVNPNGSAANFDGANDYVEVSSGVIPITKEMDFTMEFWFNSTQSSVATLFSNGKADGLGADSLTSWNIEKDASGKIHVKHKGLDFVAVNNNYFDGNWHHFALVLQRTGNLSAYVDGALQNSTPATSFNELASANMYLGVHSYYTGSTQNLAQYYQGQLDEFRFWNMSRKTEQLKRDKQNRMLGNEQGLQAFVPFEHYAVVLGTPSLTPTFNNQSSRTLTVNAMNGVNLVTTTPKIKLPRPVQFVNYTYSLNNDKIILSTTTDPAEIENVTLDITVQRAYDMHGNIMQSPKTWIAYINKNQVKWQDDEFTFEKTPDEVVTFTAPIVNTGGALKAFTIGNIPSWMTASATSGNIAPNTIQNIVFTIPAGTNIGDYFADISLTTDFGYDEMLRVNLKVKGVTPTWTVNPNNYQYSMNVFAEFKIDNVLNTNAESMIAAMHNGTVVGVANLQYVSAYDKYVAYLNVYNNTSTGDSIQFNIYDANTGLTFVNVSPNLMFADNDIQGTPGTPITFVANTQIRRDIPLNAGWTWVSFPLETNKLTNANLLMSDVNAATGDIVAGQGNGAFDQFATGLNWLGGISSNTGYKNNQSYKVKVSTIDTIVHIGSRIHPDSTKAIINVNNGWNWIGFIANKNVTVAEAMGNFNATTGDILKSQYEFAYYDNALGWVGSLTYMKPTLGYMLKSASTGTFSYPLSSFLTKLNYVQENTAIQNVYPFTPEQYNLTMTSIVKGNICNEALEQGNVMLGAFDNTNTLRGFANAILNNNSYNYYLTTYSNNNDEVLTLKYFNSTDGSVMPTAQTITFANDATQGTPSQPLEANVPDSLKCKVVLNTTTSVNDLDNNSINLSVYPNPFNDNLNIRFNKAITADVELVDVLGKVVYSSSIKNKKEYSMPIQTSITAGVYYLRLTGEVNKQVKLIKTK